MEEFFQNIWKMIVESNVLNIIWGLLVLLVGWLVAVLVSGQVVKLVDRFALNKRIEECLPDGTELPPSNIGKVLGRIVYYLILLLAILGCLTAMNLTQAAEPIKVFVGTLTEYGANIIGAAILAFLAWLVATALKYGSKTLMKMMDFDRKFAACLEMKADGKPASEVVAGVVYWVVLLFFLPSILRALKINGITDPIQQMFTRILEYVPNLIAAAAILFVGLLAAKIVRKAVTGLIQVSRLDELGKKAGVSKVFGDRGISSMVGIVAYVLVAIPVVISSLTALRIQALSDSVAGFFSKLLNAAGDILGAALLIFLAFLIGGFVSGIVAQILENFGFNKLMATLGFKAKDEENSSLPSVVVGKISFVAIIFFALIMASDILNFDSFSALLRTFLVFGGNIIIGIIVLLVGIYLSNLAADAVRGKGSDTLSMIVRIAVLVFTGAIAINNMNIGGAIVEMAFLLLLGAVCVGAALAFGLGGREIAAKKLEEWIRKLDRKE